MSHSYNELPLEVIANVFKYLNFDEIKTAQLTCHQWLKASQFKEFNQRVVLNMKLNKDNIEICKKTFRKFSNIRLAIYMRSTEELDICENNLIEFFSIPNMIEDLKCLNIESFFNSIPYETLIKIFKILPNIVELKCGGPNFLKCNITEEEHIKFEEFSNLIPTIFKNLQLLHIHSAYIHLFSKIKHLKTLFIFLYDFGDDINSQLYEIIKNNETTLKSLGFYPFAIGRQDWRELMLDFRSELLTNLKLQEFQICSYVDWPKMKDFIEKQNLISNLSMCNSRYNLTENDIISIINNLPLLEVLNLERNDAFNSTAMKKVLELRHLKILNINQAYNSFNYDITPRKNFKLVQLQCDGINLNDENFCKLFENLPNLEVLHTSTTTVSNIGIQSIIKNCKKLTELHFVGSEKITKYGLNGIDPVSSEKTGNCITELKNLEVLNVRNCHITKDLPLELKFQNLKKLILTDIFLENSILDETIFECIRKNCPNVNYLSVFLKNVDTSEEIESVIERITEKLGCNIKDWIYHHLQDGFWISISNFSIKKLIYFEEEKYT